ncbi:MAG: polyisoprenoid-binding protein [Thermoleophilia bacterium]|nr:polyisoprenoid-binding protein [Thermoleophilia bacterium]
MSTTATQLPSGTWNLDTVHSTVGFGVKHLGINTYRGQFPGIEGHVRTEDGRVTEITGTARIDSLVTKDATLTGHLLTADFFDAEAHPTGTFRSTSVELTGEDIRVEGELTLRGVTRPVTLTGTLGLGQDPYGNTRIGVAVSGQINRLDYGISWNAVMDNGVPAVAERVRLDWEVEAVLAGAEA